MIANYFVLYKMKPLQPTDLQTSNVNVSSKNTLASLGVVVLGDCCVSLPLHSFILALSTMLCSIQFINDNHQ